MKALLITYILSYGGAIIAPFLPFIGVCMYISLAIIKPTNTWFWAVPPGPYSKIVIISVIVGWVIKKFGTWNFGKASLIFKLFLGLMIWTLLSMYISATNLVMAEDFVVIMLKIFLPFVIALTLIDSMNKLKILTWTIVLSLGAVAFEENIFYLTNGNVRGGVGMNGISHEIAIGFGLAIFLGLYSEKYWQKWLSWGIAGLIAHVPLMHMSRGAMIGLVVAGIFIVIKMPKNRQTLSLTILAIVAISVIAGPSVVEEFSTIFASEEERDNSAQSRFDLWADMFTVALSNPVFGVGPNHWMTISHLFGWPEGKQGHGLWIQMFAELGLVGGILYIGFYGFSVLRFMKCASNFEGVNNWILVPLYGATASILCWLAEANFGTFWSVETPYYLVLLGAGALKVHHINLQSTEFSKSVVIQEKSTSINSGFA